MHLFLLLTIFYFMWWNMISSSLSHFMHKEMSRMLVKVKFTLLLWKGDLTLYMIKIKAWVDVLNSEVMLFYSVAPLNIVSYYVESETLFFTLPSCWYMEAFTRSIIESCISQNKWKWCISLSTILSISYIGLENIKMYSILSIICYPIFLWYEIPIIYAILF